MFSLNCKGRLVLIDRPLVMGILNINDDSFYAGSRVHNKDELFKKVNQMLSEGADILDIGGQSTRPGSNRISVDEELSRVLPAIEFIDSKFPDVLLAIDTYHAEVAGKSVEAGASIVNDISAGEMDIDMISTVANLKVPYICMHTKGVPETMQEQTEYEDVTKEVLDYFIKKIKQCRLAGINDIIVDPGFGFGKNMVQNFTLLKNFCLFKILETPLMAGLSRKSSIYKTLNVSVGDSLNGSTVLHTIALQNGANILRVHDVKEAREAVALYMAYDKA
ncbi:MAG: dihydropteroate synthase, partial [Bacteroidota bacterium]|nr:dihydropteroate synthase [Bacteroidota bacterium]